MTDTLWTIAGLLWGAWAAQAVLAALMVKKLASRFARPRREGFDAYRPPAAVIVPFKGLEPALDDHLDALGAQDYPAYRVLLIVESQDDPAYPALIRARQRHPEGKFEVLTVGPAGPAEGQKVHNHLTAIAHLQRAGGGEQVWVFADSDAVPGPGWLGNLIGPLVQAQVTAVTTGYRWLVPEGENGVIGFASHVASIINASAMGFLGREQQNHAWGGSMAMRVDTARELGLTDWLRGALSDDYQVTRMTRAAGQRIYFVPSCLIASPVTLSWPQLFEFARRQYLITRTHAPLAYLGGLWFLFYYQFGLWTGLIAIAYILTTKPGWWVEPGFLMPAIAMAAAAAANQCRAFYRVRTVRRAFGPEMVQRLRPTLRIDRWLTPIWMTINFVLMLSAAVGRTITWRGITYRIKGPQRIEKMADSG